MMLIDPDCLKKVIYVYDLKRFANPNKFVADCIRNIPTIEAEPVKHGRWDVVDEQEPRRYGCSKCKRLSWDASNYCPYCGTRMDGDEK